MPEAGLDISVEAEVLGESHDFLALQKQMGRYKRGFTWETAKAEVFPNLDNEAVRGILATFVESGLVSCRYERGAAVYRIK